MDLTGQEYNLPDGQSPKVPLLVDKKEVIKALVDLIEQYPSEEIPLDVIEQALVKFLPTRNSGLLKNNQAIEKLDKVLAQYKIPRTS